MLGHDAIRPVSLFQAGGTNQSWLPYTMTKLLVDGVQTVSALPALAHLPGGDTYVRLPAEFDIGIATVSRIPVSAAVCGPMAGAPSVTGDN